MALTSQERTNIVKLTVAMFNAAPGANYLSDLGTAYEANGRSLAQLASTLSDNSAYLALNPASQSAAQFASAFLTPLGLQANAVALDFVTSRFNAGATKGQIAFEAALALDGSADPAFADARAILVNKTAVAEYYSVTKAILQTSVATLQQVVAPVTKDSTSVVTANAAIDSTTNTGTGGGTTQALTTSADNLVGTTGADTFNATYDAGVVTDTLGAADILSGGAGIDTLNISHIIDTAITPPDALWTGISGIEKLVFSTSGSGAQTITSGTAFQAAFAATGVDLTAMTSGAGAITINLEAFAGAARVTASSVAGALVISGANLAQVDAITTGAGAQTVTSTGAGNVKVNATSGDGATNITTGAGSDTITLLATSAMGANSITAGAGADTINLVTGAFAATDTLVQADGASKASTGNTISGLIAAGQTVVFGNGLDRVYGFAGGVDVLDVGTAGLAQSAVGLNATALTANKTLYLSGSYAQASGTFTIAADGAGADTLVLDTTAAADQSIATADTWVVLIGTSSAALNSGSFI